MDEAESSGGSVDFGNDAGMANSPIVFAPLPENQIAALQHLCVFDTSALAVLRGTSPGQRIAELQIHVSGKSGTVESAWAFAPIPIGFAQVFASLGNEQVGAIGLRLNLLYGIDNAS